MNIRWLKIQNTFQCLFLAFLAPACALGDTSQEISFGARLPLIAAETGVKQAMPFPVDINGDGLMDLLVGVKISKEGGYTGKVRVYLNRGTAKNPVYDDFTYLTVNGAELAEEQTAGGCQGLQAQFGDYNGDGYLDLAVGHIDGAIEVYPGTAKAGIYGTPVQLLQNTDVSAKYRTYVTFFDRDGDGRDEVFTGYMGGGFTEFDYNTASGSWKSADVTGVDGAALQIPEQSNGRRTTPAFADVDGDGFADLLSGSTDGDVYLFPSVMQGVWSSDCSCLVEGEANGERSRISVGDIDGDGIVDLVIGYSDGNVSWYKGTYDGETISLTLNGQKLVAGETFQVIVDCGVQVDWPVVVSAGPIAAVKSVKATGLPTGIKLVKDKSTGALSLTGVPKKASSLQKGSGEYKPFNVRLKVTATDKTTVTYDVAMTVCPRDDWSVGYYVGPVDGELGRGTMTAKVAVNGSISGKYVIGKKSYSFSATSLKGITEDGKWLADVNVKGFGDAVVDTISIDRRVFDSSMPHVGVLETAVSGSGIAMSTVAQDLWSRSDKSSFRLPVFVSKTTVGCEFSNGGDSGTLAFKFGTKGKVNVKGVVNGSPVSGNFQLILDEIGPSACMCFEKSFNGRIVVSFPKIGFCRTFDFSGDYNCDKITEDDIFLDIKSLSR